MTPRQEVLKFVSDNEVDMDDRSEATDLNVDLWSPPGTVWVATGCHSLVIHYFTDKPAGWRDLLTDVRKGLEPCEEPDCEGCV